MADPAAPAPPAPPQPAPPPPEQAGSGNGGLTRDDLIAVFSQMIPIQTNAMIQALSQVGGSPEPEAPLPPEEEMPPEPMPEPMPEDMDEDEDETDLPGDEMDEYAGMGMEDRMPEPEPMPDTMGDDIPEDEDLDLYCNDPDVMTEEDYEMAAPSSTNAHIPGMARRRPRSDQYARDKGNGKVQRNGKATGNTPDNGRSPDRYARKIAELERQVRDLSERLTTTENEAEFADRYARLVPLSQEHVFDPGEELETTADYSREQFDSHLGLIKSRYAKRDPETVGDPDNVPHPEDGPDRNARTGGPDRGNAPPALNKKQMAAVQRYAYENGTDYRKSIAKVKEERPELWG